MDAFGVLGQVLDDYQAFVSWFLNIKDGALVAGAARAGVERRIAPTRGKSRLDSLTDLSSRLSTLIARARLTNPSLRSRTFPAHGRKKPTSTMRPPSWASTPAPNRPARRGPIDQPVKYQVRLALPPQGWAEISGWSGPGTACHAYFLMRTILRIQARRVSRSLHSLCAAKREKVQSNSRSYKFHRCRARSRNWLR